VEGGPYVIGLHHWLTSLAHIAGSIRDEAPSPLVDHLAQTIGVLAESRFQLGSNAVEFFEIVSRDNSAR
jgi:hypothetical protein